MTHLTILKNFLLFTARVQGTAKQIEDLEKEAAENKQLTGDAKMKVRMRFASNQQILNRLPHIGFLQSYTRLMMIF